MRSGLPLLFLLHPLVACDGGLDASDAVPISAKTGLGIDLALEAIVQRLPPPKGDEAAPVTYRNGRGTPAA